MEKTLIEYFNRFNSFNDDLNRDEKRKRDSIIKFNTNLKGFYKHILLNFNEYKNITDFEYEIKKFFFINELPKNFNDYLNILFNLVNNNKKVCIKEILFNRYSKYPNRNGVNPDGLFEFGSLKNHFEIYVTFDILIETIELEWNQIENKEKFIEQLVKWTRGKFGLKNTDSENIYKYVIEDKLWYIIYFKRKLFPLLLIRLFDYNYFNFYKNINNKILDDLFYNPIIKKCFFEEYYSRTLESLDNIDKFLYPNNYIRFKNVLVDLWELKFYDVIKDLDNIKNYCFETNIFSNILMDNKIDENNKINENNKIDKNNKMDEKIKANIDLYFDLIKALAICCIKNSKHYNKVNNKNYIIIFPSFAYNKKGERNYFFDEYFSFIAENLLKQNSKIRMSNIIEFKNREPIKNFCKVLNDYSQFFNLIFINITDIGINKKSYENLLYKLSEFTNVNFVIRIISEIQGIENLSLDNCDKNICDKLLDFRFNLDYDEIMNHILPFVNNGELFKYVLNEVKNIMNKNYVIEFSETTKNNISKLKYKSNDYEFFINELIQYNKKSSIKISTLCKEFKNLLSKNNNKLKVSNKIIIDLIIGNNIYKNFLDNKFSKLNCYELKY